jgi:transcriptional regulator with XRE-family HTH domain
VATRKPSPQIAFGARVRELRYAADLTQEELAARCGLFRTYLSRIENGTANPTLTMIHALATSLKVDVTLLFAPAAAPAPPSVKRSPPVKAARVVRAPAGTSRGRVR